MYASSTQLKEKLKAEVELTFSDGTSFKGEFFVNAQERILDVLNDQRDFLPFVTEEGKFTVVNKRYITAITPVEQELNPGHNAIPAHLVDRR